MKKMAMKTQLTKPLPSFTLCAEKVAGAELRLFQTNKRVEALNKILKGLIRAQRRSGNSSKVVLRRRERATKRELNTQAKSEKTQKQQLDELWWEIRRVEEIAATGRDPGDQAVLMRETGLNGQDCKSSLISNILPDGPSRSAHD